MNINNKLQKIIFSWKDIENDCILLSKLIKKNNKKYKGIVIVSRGGLAIAALLSRFLDIKLLDVVCITSYNYKDNTKNNLDIIKKPEVAIKDNGKNWLIIDDLIDSGDTYKYITKQLKEADFACLYNKSSKEEHTTNIIFAKNYPKNSWIEFPWERILIK